MRFLVTSLLLVTISLASPLLEVNREKSNNGLKDSKLVTRGPAPLVPRIFIGPKPNTPAKEPPLRPANKDEDPPVRPGVATNRCLLGRKRCAPRRPLGGAQATLKIDARYLRTHGKPDDDGWETLNENPFLGENDMNVLTKDDIWVSTTIKNDPEVAEKWLKEREAKMK